MLFEQVSSMRRVSCVSVKEYSDDCCVLNAIVNLYGNAALYLTRRFFNRKIRVAPWIIRPDRRISDFSVGAFLIENFENTYRKE